MTDGIEIKITGVNAIRSLLNPDLAMRGVKEGIKKATAHVQDNIAQYPPSPKGRPQFPNGFKTLRQQRYFFWALRHGEIVVPYPRGEPPSETLGRKWTTKITDGGLTGVVGNNASYAQWVQSGKKQSRYHKLTGWKTDAQIIKSEAAMVNDIVNKELESVFLRGF